VVVSTILFVLIFIHLNLDKPRLNYLDLERKRPVGDTLGKIVFFEILHQSFERETFLEEVLLEHLANLLAFFQGKRKPLGTPCVVFAVAALLLAFVLRKVTRRRS